MSNLFINLNSLHVTI